PHHPHHEPPRAQPEPRERRRDRAVRRTAPARSRMTSARRFVLAVALLAGCAGLPPAHEGTYHGSDADLSVTRIVHGSLVLELGKSRLLVDPWFNSAVATRQTEALGMLPEKLPPADAVLLTHKHAGHYDPDALRTIAKKTPRAIVPPHMADAVRKLGFTDVTPLDWWDQTTVGPIRVTA